MDEQRWRRVSEWRFQWNPMSIVKLVTDDGNNEKRECRSVKSTYPAPRARVLEIIMLFVLLFAVVVCSFVFVMLWDQDVLLVIRLQNDEKGLSRVWIAMSGKNRPKFVERWGKIYDEQLEVVGTNPAHAGASVLAWAGTDTPTHPRTKSNRAEGTDGQVVQSSKTNREGLDNQQQGETW